MLNIISYLQENFIKNILKSEEDFLKDPKKFAEYIFRLMDELHQLGIQILQGLLEDMDRMICESLFRQGIWIVEGHHPKTLLTSLGLVTFKRTLFFNKQTKEYAYLLDRILGLEPKQRLTEDTLVRIFEEAVQTSYERGGQQASLTTQVSRQTVKNKIHSLRFPPEPDTPQRKRKVDYLYIDADEDHVALQFQKKRKDLTKAKNGVKNNTLIAKMVCIYEGKREETLHGKRKVLINRHCFCGANHEESNEKFWDDIYKYLDRNYELTQVKKIYLNADGGSWIKAGIRRLKGISYVLDGFHLEKYLKKLVPHLKGEARSEALEALRNTIRKKTKDEFRALVEEQKERMAAWRNQAKVEEAAEYLLSNWMAAKLRLQHKEGVLGSSTESHVSHILSARMSSRPMGWSRQGAAKMAKLRAYYMNGGDLLKLVRYQKEALSKARGEETILSSTQILKSEKNRYRELGKYIEYINHSLSSQVKKKLIFQEQIWGL